jgi:hypothetical protein
MTAPTMTLTAPVQADPVLEAWALYRRSQQVPVPANPGDLIRARDVLHSCLDPHARTRVTAPATGPDLDAIEDAADALIAAVEWHCGPEWAARVSGEEGGQP